MNRAGSLIPLRSKPAFFSAPLPGGNPMLRRSHRPRRNSRGSLLLEVLEDRLAPSIVLGQQPGAPNTTQFHADAARTGFYQNETFLTPANVASHFGPVWQSPVLDGHLYASPLYQDTIL